MCVHGVKLAIFTEFTKLKTSPKFPAIRYKPNIIYLDGRELRRERERERERERDAYGFSTFSDLSGI
jgi:hypothetical protein